MRICYFTDTFLPSTNGVALSTETYRKSLTQQGHSVFIFAPHAEGERSQEGVFRFPSFTLPRYPDYSIALPFFSHLKEAVRRLKPDIVHLQHIFTVSTRGLHVARALDVPVVHTEHTLIAEYSQYMAFLRPFVRSLLIKRIRTFCNRCDRVITPSKPMREVVRGYGVTAPIDVNPTGIDVSRYVRRDARLIHARFRIAPDADVLLYVGRLAEEKNVMFLLEVFGALVTKGRKLHLLLVGDGPQRKLYERFVASAGLREAVTFTGILPHAEVIKLFGDVKLLVFPSLTDTQGIVVGEAMAAATPVVAANRMGPKDIIEDGKSGFLLPPKIGPFVDTIAKLLDNPTLWHKFARAARARAREKLSIEATTQKLLEIYVDTRNRYRPQR